MKDGQWINKYIVEFNRIASQIQGYREGALWHHFYNGLPNCIKDEVSRIGKNSTLSDLRHLVQAIDAHYWECKSEDSCQMKPSANPFTSKSTSSSSGGKPNLTTKLGKDGKLTAAERKNHFDNKLCMFCGLAGHITKDCPKSTSRVSKGCTAATTLETKLEVSSETKK